MASTEPESAWHRFEAHTGEVRLSLGGPSLEAVFAEAGVALAELMLGELPLAPASAPPLAIEVQARDRNALLVEWLNELVFHSETRKLIFTRFQLERVEQTSLRATIWGVEPVAIKTAVKAATLHGVRVERDGEGWRGSVVLDV